MINFSRIKSKIADDIELTIKEECENWIRDFLQKYKSVSESLLMQRGGKYFGNDVLRKCLKEMKDDDYLDKKGNNWIWRMANKIAEDTVEYKEYFDKKMKQHGIKSPEDLKPGERANFFRDVDRGWKSKKEKQGK